MSEPAAQSENGKFLTREQVTGAITTLMSKLTDKTHEKIVQDLFDLAAQIDSLYAELGSLQPSNLKQDHLKSAHDELSAVVESTSVATFQIIGEMEKLEKVAKELPADKGALVVDSVTRVYEACSFQDITGQRITKVVKTLKAVEEKVDALIHTLGGPKPQKAGDDRTGEAALLNGPSLPGQGISQDEIDKLLGF